MPRGVEPNIYRAVNPPGGYGREEPWHKKSSNGGNPIFSWGLLTVHLKPIEGQSYGFRL